MRFITYITFATAAFTPSEASRRWRFAVPFPGGIETTIPDPAHKAPFDDAEKNEKLFDTKEVSRRGHKPKFVVDDPKESGSTPPKYQPVRENLDLSHIPWIL